MKNIIDVARLIKDEEAKNILSNPDSFPKDWVDNARRRLE